MREKRTINSAAEHWWSCKAAEGEAGRPSVDIGKEMFALDASALASLELHAGEFCGSPRVPHCTRCEYPRARDESCNTYSDNTPVCDSTA